MVVQLFSKILYVEFSLLIKSSNTNENCDAVIFVASSAALYSCLG